jgi:predicted RNase H-like HicB family nuclease
LAPKLRDIRTEVFQERDGSYAIVCSALGVYSVGKTLREAKRNFEEALDLLLSVVREKTKVALRRTDSFVTVPLGMIQVGVLNRILKDWNISREDFLESL